MRHKYSAHAVVLARTPLREAGVLVTLLTSDFGLIRARAEGLRRPGAKLAHALQTFAECEVTLLRGKDGWRLAGAVLVHNWFTPLSREGRLRAGRVSSLVLRLVQGETAEPRLFEIVTGFISDLPDMDEAQQDVAECLTALRILNVLGLDSGDLPPDVAELAPEERRGIITRINRGLTASGL